MKRKAPFGLVLLLLLVSSAADAFTLSQVPGRQQQPAIRHATTRHSAASAELTPSAVGFYVHIPYCRQRCRYCNFAIVPIGNRFDDGQNADSRVSKWRSGFEAIDNKYTSAVCKELESLFRQEKEEPTKIPLHSIYFGGGTPILAPMSTIETILQTILEHPDSPFASSSEMEITIEMDPGTFDVEKLQSLRTLGFNRISLGVQSFSDETLALLGRQHTSQDIWESVQMLSKVFDESRSDNLNYSIDLISGLPGVSLADWAETLYTAVNRLQPPPKHLSIYDLQIESGTVFGNWYGGETYDTDETSHNRSAQRTWHATRGEQPSVLKPTLPTEEDAAFQYQFTAGYLRAKGFEHYEVSSYALRTGSGCSPWRSRHNQVYWGYDTSWYAVGVGATSFVRDRTLARPKTMVDYIHWVDQEKQSKQKHPPSNLDLLMDVALKRLRTAEGLDLNWVKREFGQEHVASILKGAGLGLELGLATTIETENTHALKLADSRGLLYSNSIISSIFVELEELESNV